MILLLVCMQLTRDLFEIAKFRFIVRAVRITEADDRYTHATTVVLYLIEW